MGVYGVRRVVRTDGGEWSKARDDNRLESMEDGAGGSVRKADGLG